MMMHRYTIRGGRTQFVGFDVNSAHRENEDENI